MGSYYCPYDRPFLSAQGKITSKEDRIGLRKSSSIICVNMFDLGSISGSYRFDTNVRWRSGSSLKCSFATVSRHINFFFWIFCFVWWEIDDEWSCTYKSVYVQLFTTTNYSAIISSIDDPIHTAASCNAVKWWKCSWLLCHQTREQQGSPFVYGCWIDRWRR